jgi:hypothetical protein
MQLPDRPNLRHLRDQAKDLVRSGAVSTLADAQLHIARQYGFASWPRLKQHVESVHDAGRLRQAIRSNDLTQVERLLTSKPELRQVLIDDVPLQAQAQPGRTSMMELLVRHGADVNGLCWGWFPVLFTPCENLEPEPLQWLLEHGADPNRGNPRDPGTALDYVLQTYPRDPKRLSACIELLIGAGGHTRYDLPGVLALLRGRNDELAALLHADPTLLQRHYPELDCGPSSGNISLKGATLLHVAAEYGFLDASRLLLDRGADVNARADVDGNGLGGQTAIFHALAHFTGANPEITRLLIDRGADLTIRARVPGRGEHTGKVLDVSVVEYNETFSTRFPL